MYAFNNMTFINRKRLHFAQSKYLLVMEYDSADKATTFFRSHLILGEKFRSGPEGNSAQTCGTSAGVTSAAHETISFITRKIAV